MTFAECLPKYVHNNSSAMQLFVLNLQFPQFLQVIVQLVHITRFVLFKVSINPLLLHILNILKIPLKPSNLLIHLHIRLPRELGLKLLLDLLIPVQNGLEPRLHLLLRILLPLRILPNLIELPTEFLNRQPFRVDDVTRFFDKFLKASD